MRNSNYLFSSLLILMGFIACKKSDNPAAPSNARTVANFSGNYSLTALLANYGGYSFNVYDTLPDCQKDNIITLNSNFTADFVDAGTKCVPPSDSLSTWSLSANTDTIYLAGNAGLIKSWDGKTLILTSNESINGYAVVATTTLTKK